MYTGNHGIDELVKFYEYKPKVPSTAADLVIGKNTILWRGKIHQVYPKQALVLLALQTADVMLTLRDMVEIVYGSVDYYKTRTMEVVISKLNKRLNHDIVQRITARHRNQYFKLNL